MEYGYCSHKGKPGLLSHWQLSLVKGVRCLTCKHKSIDQTPKYAQSVGKNIERNVNNIHLKIIFKKNFIIKSLPLVVSSSEGRVDTFNSERIK